MAKLLVVDDEPDYRSRLEYFLAAAGHDVLVAAAPRQAREIAAAFLPDVLVVDWMLGTPETGIDLARQMREFIPYLKIILITGFVEPSLEGEGADLDIFRLLTKPFSSRELLDAVAEAVATHHTPHGTVGS